MLGLRKWRGLAFYFALGFGRLDNRGDLNLIFVICGSHEFAGFGTVHSVQRTGRRCGGRHANWGSLREMFLPMEESLLHGGQSRLSHLCRRKRGRRGSEDRDRRLRCQGRGNGHVEDRRVRHELVQEPRIAKALASFDD